MDAHIQRIAEHLAGAPVRSIIPAKRGGNSQILRIETAAVKFALKVYPSRAGDTRNRADVEWRTLHFLMANGLAAVPTPIARDAAGNFLLMEWIDGVPVVDHTAADLDQAMNFIGEIFVQSSDLSARLFPPASEACLSMRAIIEQIEWRLGLLISTPGLDRFLNRTFRPLLREVKAAVSVEAAYGVDLALEWQRLIPADFGFHNALRETDGRLRFFDFEYFGWDDPVKLTADFLMHPAMQLTSHENLDVARRVAAMRRDDTAFVDRLQQRLPLFALRWMLILLNPFRLDRVPMLSGEDRDCDALLQDRLKKCQALMEWTGGRRLDGLNHAGFSGGSNS